MGITTKWMRSYLMRMEKHRCKNVIKLTKESNGNALLFNSVISLLNHRWCILTLCMIPCAFQKDFKFLAWRKFHLVLAWPIVLKVKWILLKVIDKNFWALSLIFSKTHLKVSGALAAPIMLIVILINSIPTQGKVWMALQLKKLYTVM